MKPRNNKTVFVCQLTGRFLKVLKYTPGKKNNSFQVLSESIAGNADIPVLSSKAAGLFKKLKLNAEPVMVSLPHAHIACRYLKVPTQNPEQIENIIALQAARYLPYPEEELITGYQLISTDTQGYAYINLLIVHRDMIDRMVKIFKNPKIRDLKICLSSYGLSALFSVKEPSCANPVMILDIDADQVELAIVKRQKLLFSRHLNWEEARPDRNDVLLEEIHKTELAYHDEVSKEPISKIIVTGLDSRAQDFVEFLNQKHGLSQTAVEFYSYEQAYGLGEKGETGFSSASLVGLSLEPLEETLNLLPVALKEESRKILKTKKMVVSLLYVLGILGFLSAGMNRNMDNKARLLGYWKQQYENIAPEAKPLEEMEQKLNVLQKRFSKKESGLEFYYELYRIIRPGVSLTSFSYRKDTEIVLRGQTRELNSVLEFVSDLRKSALLKGLDVKLRYASNKKTPAGDLIDFEISATGGKKK